METKLPLVVIVGPTASGKTSLAITLAEQFNGEIICADSRTVYRGMDIGTAKPTKAEQAAAPHWGIDLVQPNERFTVADFKKYALDKIEEIRARGHMPILAGGTGLYVDAVLFDYQFGKGANVQHRKTLQDQSLEQLIRYCIKNNIKLPENKENKRHVIRAIEQKGINNSRRITPIDFSIIVGITTDKDELMVRIKHRIEHLLHNGVVEEAIILGKKYGWNSEAMTSNIYSLIKKYNDNEYTLDELKEKSVVRDWRLAKRQLTWFRRNRFINWTSLENAEHYVSHELARLTGSWYDKNKKVMSGRE